MRATISMPDDVFELAEAIRTRESRPTFSNVCEAAIRHYHGANDVAKEEAAALMAFASEIGMPKALAAVKRAARKR